VNGNPPVSKAKWLSSNRN